MKEISNKAMLIGYLVTVFILLLICILASPYTLKDTVHTSTDATSSDATCINATPSDTSATEEVLSTPIDATTENTETTEIQEQEPLPEIASTEQPQAILFETHQEPGTIATGGDAETIKIYEATELMYHGVIYWGGYKWTWYSERVLPGGGLNIPGRHTDENGYVCDENNFICLASSDLPKGAVVDTPFGKQGKIYDCGCGSGILDVYCSW